MSHTPHLRDEDLLLSLDGWQPGEAAADAQVHLAECAGCRSRLQAFADTDMRVADTELRVLEESRGSAVIVRTAWVYSAHGANFVKTMLRLMAEREQLGVVADQVGTPTWARLLAGALWELALRPEIGGILHWTDLGVASWYDFALAIQEQALLRGMLARAVPINPIRTEDYPTPARRPAYSVLDKTRSLQELHCPRMHWRMALGAMLDDLQHSG